MTKHKGSYYLPEPSYWPIIASISLTCIVVGAINWLHGNAFGSYLLEAGFLMMVYVVFGWFAAVVKENQAGFYKTKKMDHSFRLGMIWFIFSEVMFFSAFFGVLFYARIISVPWLGGEGQGFLTNILLWPDFHAAWPLFKTPNPAEFVGPKAVMETWEIPALNTLILLSSGATITVAHWGVLKNKRHLAIAAQAVTLLLGVAFLFFQFHEYGVAYAEKGLKLSSGIYGTTFFMLTGFHGLHVTLGSIMLAVILIRLIKGHFDPLHHFAFEAVAWYWHFVDVVWLGLFTFVYWL